MNDELKYLSQQVARQRLDRRSFLGRAGALGLTAASAGTLLSSAVMAQGVVKGGILKLAVDGCEFDCCSGEPPLGRTVG